MTTNYTERARDKGKLVTGTGTTDHKEPTYTDRREAIELYFPGKSEKFYIDMLALDDINKAYNKKAEKKRNPTNPDDPAKNTDKTPFDAIRVPGSISLRRSTKRSSGKYKPKY